MTSNLGSDAYGVEKFTREMVELKVIDTVRSFFKPEFINRLDSIVVFNPMNKVMMQEIVKLQLAQVGERLQKAGYSFTYTEKLEKYLMEKGFDTVYGARPLKRVINEEVLDEIASLIVDQEVSPGVSLQVDYSQDTVVVKRTSIH